MRYVILFILILVLVASTFVDAFGQEEPDSTLYLLVAGPDLIFDIDEVVKVAILESDSVDAYFFSVDVLFDPDVLEYDTLVVAPNLTGAILVGDRIGENRLAVSVTLTDTTAVPEALSYFKVDFNIHPTPVDLSTTIRFENVYASDVAGNEMIYADPDPVTIQIVGDPEYSGGGGDGGDDGGDGGSGGDDGDGGSGDGDGGDDPVDPDMNIDIVAHDLVRYGFEYSNNSPSRSIQINRDKNFELFGGSYTYANNDYPLQALRSTSWFGAEDGSKYWTTEFSSAGFENLELFWQQWGSNTGPRDFRVDYSLDGVTWTQIPNSAIVVTNSKTSGSFYDLQLDDTFDNQPSIQLRWAMDSHVTVAGEDTISNAGTNMISDIVVQGWAFNDSLLVYRPGDTNNDGLIDHTDVLPLGVHWMSAGPKAKNTNLSWNLRAKQEWVPVNATYADTNGDGYVNHHDLQPIGMFYGRSYALERSIPEMILVHDFDLSASTTREIRYRVSLEDASIIKGVSGSLHMDGMDPSDYDMRLEPMFDEVFRPELEAERRATMLSWTMGLDDGRAFAWVERVPRDVSKNQVTQDLFELVVEVRGDISALSGDLRLSDVSIVDETGIVYKDQEVVLTNLTKINEFEPMIPTEFRMLPAYPNPFNPSTSIRWAMPDEGHVKVRVMDMLGRQVGVIGDAMYGPGEHGLQFDAIGLSSGVYLVVVESLGNVGVQKVLLVK